MKRIRAIFFFAFFAVLFSAAQEVLVPEWSYPADEEDHTAKVREFRQLEEDSVQVIFLGTSHVQYGVIPMQIYEEKGICTYNLSVSAQRLSAAYYHLKNALQYQHPQLVMLDTSPLFLDSFHNTQWRYVLDRNLPFGPLKLEAAGQYAKEYAEWEREEEEEEESTGESAEAKTGAETDESAEAGEAAGGRSIAESVREMSRQFNAALSVMVPLYQYHNRWTQLTAADFEIEPEYAYYSKGYKLCTLTDHAWDTVDHINRVADDLAEEKTFEEWVIRDGEEQIEEAESERYRDTPSKEQLQWLLKIKDLCDSQGVELRLFKVPVLNSYRNYASSWTRARSLKVREIAEENGLCFFDMLYELDMEGELDRFRDFRDNGMHLNYYGASKVTACIGDYLKDECGLRGRYRKQYRDSCRAFDRVKKAAALQGENDWYAYMEELAAQSSGKTVLIAMRGREENLLTEEEVDAMRAIGVKISYQERLGSMSYIGVLRDGKSVLEKLSDLPVREACDLDDAHHAEMLSVGSANTSSLRDQVSVKINGTECLSGGFGLNLLVWDEATGTLVDRVCFRRETEGGALVCDRNSAQLHRDIVLYEHLLYNEVG